MSNKPKNKFTLDFVLSSTQGQIHSAVAQEFYGFGTDTRKSLEGQLFFALRGESFDAHNFLKEAVRVGATGLIVDTLDAVEIPSGVTVIRVNETLKALQDLARHWRHSLKAKVVGITGSNGKTSTKEFALAILNSHFKTHASQGSFNNHWGVPMTLLEASPEDEVVLVEMGMNHSGEITALSRIAEPDYVVCTMVGTAHMGNFSNGIEGVAQAKEEIYLANPKALQIFNFDNEYTMAMFDRAIQWRGAERCRAFSSFSAGAEVSLKANRMTLEGLELTGHIGGILGQSFAPVYGRQNVVNLMAAASIALALGLEPEAIWAGFKKCQTGWGRNQTIKLDNGAVALFDGYNANPDSVKMLLKNFFETHCEGKKFCILAEMLELGEHTESYHQEIGEMAGQTDLEGLWFYGPSAKAFRRGVELSGFSKTLFVSDSYDEALAKQVKNMLNPKDIVVMKGSRGMKLERVMQYLKPGFASK